MTCPICDGTGELAGQPQCWYCRGTCYVAGDDYVRRHHDHVSKRAAISAALKTTHGKNGQPEIETVKP